MLLAAVAAAAGAAAAAALLRDGDGALLGGSWPAVLLAWARPGGRGSGGAGRVGAGASCSSNSGGLEWGSCALQLAWQSSRQAWEQLWSKWG